MNPLVAHVFSGRILFTGIPLMIFLIVGCEWIARPPLRRLMSAMVWVCGGLALSTAAVPWWVMGLWVVSLGCWSARTWLAAHQWPRWASLAFPIGVAVALVAAEIPWAVRPTVPRASARAVVVLGDSLSGGLGEREGTPWPLQLRDAYQVPVQNLSEAGATTQHGLRQIQKIDQYPGLVFVELGGNDLLGGRSCQEFEHDLDGILAYLHDHQRTVVMLELPVLPGKNHWGVVQRRLARKYRCPLLSKLLLVDVLASPGSTVDTLHLTQAGHRRLPKPCGTSSVCHCPSRDWPHVPAAREDSEFVFQFPRVPHVGVQSISETAAMCRLTRLASCWLSGLARQSPASAAARMCPGVHSPQWGFHV